MSRPVRIDTAGALRDLRRAPGVGISIAQDLLDLGIVSVADLSKAEPDDLYQRLCVLTGTHVDRCMLYTFRCAVYFARHECRGTSPDPEKLKWWNWKDAPGVAAKIRRRSQASAHVGLR